jgi:hypothetical protein
MYSFLSIDEDPVAIGYMNYQRILTPYSQTWSPDGRYLLALNDSDPVGYGVYDFIERRYVLADTLEPADFITITYGEGGFVVSANQERHLLYRYADSDKIDLPEARGVYFDVLADGDPVFMQTEEAGGRGTSIFRYSPDDDAFALLVGDAQVFVQ